MGAKSHSLGLVGQKVHYAGKCEWGEAKSDQFFDEDGLIVLKAEL